MFPKFAALIGASLLASSVYAQDFFCPDINEIKDEGLGLAEPISPGYFFSYNMSTYNTDSTWVFLMSPIAAKSAPHAISAANDLLATMTAPGVSQEVEGRPVCFYNTGHQSIFAVASNEASPQQLKQYISKK